jgi:hypothetical protein
VQVNLGMVPVDVDCGRDFLVSHHLLHAADVSPTIQQVRGKGVPEQVRREPYPDAPADYLEPVPHVLGREAGEHLLGRRYNAPPAGSEPRQGFHAWFSKGYGTLVAALALETNSVPL